MCLASALLLVGVVGATERVYPQDAQNRGSQSAPALELLPVQGNIHMLAGAGGNITVQVVRALCGLPLGDARLHSAAVMVNLLGDLWYPDGSGHVREPDWHKLLAVPNLKLHLYGKHHARPGRKMGHFTVLGEDMEKVHETAMAARAAIGIRGE